MNALNTKFITTTLQHQWKGLIALPVAAGWLALGLSVASHGSGDCVWPDAMPNPLCILSPGSGGGCLRWEWNITPINCGTDYSSFRCQQDSVSGWVWLFTKPGSSDLECGCHGEWAPNPDNPTPKQINQAFTTWELCWDK